MCPHAHNDWITVEEIRIEAGARLAHPAALYRTMGTAPVATQRVTVVAGLHACKLPVTASRRARILGCRAAAEAPPAAFYRTIGTAPIPVIRVPIVASLHDTHDSVSAQ